VTTGFGSPGASGDTRRVGVGDRDVSPHDWRRVTDPWAAMQSLLADRFAERRVTIRPSWNDFPQIRRLVRDHLAEYGHTGFRRTWPRIAEPLDLEFATEQARWEARCLGELAWVCVRGVGDNGFAVWDTGKLIRHRTRLRRLDLPVPDHHAPGEPSVRAALLWTGADLARWERLLAATGRLSALAALAAAVSSLVEARCGQWPAVSRDPDRLGSYSLTRPDGDAIAIDLGLSEDQTTCQIGFGRAVLGRPAQQRWAYEYADPQFLVVLASKLRELGFDPRPPAWPVDSPGSMH
jgi:hypothetical protein